MTPRPEVQSGAPVVTIRPGLLLACILLIAANLRALIATVGPVLPLIAASTGITPAAQGVLVALPVAAFALFSLVAQRSAARHGLERVVLLALIVLLAGATLRSLPAPLAGEWVLFVGTIAIGGAIAVGNVLLPVLAHEGFPDRVPTITAGYVAVQSALAALASTLAVPLAHWFGSWRLAIGVWAVLVIAAIATWRPGMVTARPRPQTWAENTAEKDLAAPSIWQSPLAWQVAAYFGLQSSAFYVLLSWLPSVEQDMGIGAETAGVHMGAFLVAGIPATMVVPAILRRGADQRLVAMAVPVALLSSMLGLVIAPGILVVWVALAGFTLGASLVVSLSLISLRAGGSHLTGGLSSMVQGTAYGMVAVTLLVAGVVREVAGPGRHVLTLVVASAVVLIGLGGLVGRNRHLES